VLTQTPTPLPDAGALADLDPGVAITLLVAGVILALLTYFGGPIRDRLSKKPPAPPPPSAPPAVSPPDTAPQATPAAGQGSAGAAIDAAERRTDRFIDTLLRQVEDSAGREELLEKRIETLERRVRDLEAEKLQMMLWQRDHR
jgi:hypothetical protein